MKIAGLLVCTTILLFSAPAVSQPQSLTAKDTLAATRLPAEELRQITDAIEQSAFDTPESWAKELRARRIDLGGSPGIVLQGTELLCGGTGNCQLFVFRKVDDKWSSLFGMDQTPIAESFELGPGVSHGIKDMAVVTNSGARSGQQVLYKFDGRFYRPGP